MNKVYITQNNGKNYTASHQYGEPIFVTRLEYTSIKNSADNANIHRDISEMAGKFNPAEDYVLLSGDPVVIALILHAILTEYGYVKILKWQSQGKIYVPITLSTQGIDNVNGV